MAFDAERSRLLVTSGLEMAPIYQVSRIAFSTLLIFGCWFADECLVILRLLRTASW